MKHCANPACPHFVRHRRCAEYGDAASCSDCGGPLTDGARPEVAVAAAPKIAGALWARLAVTVAVALAAYLLRFLELPGVALVRANFSSLGMRVGLIDRSIFSVVAMWVTPFVTAFSLVETVALIVPRWRRLRHAGPDGRRALTRASLAVAGALALVQGFFIGQWLLSTIPWGAPINIPFFAPVVAVTLTAGSFALYGLALLNDRRGLGNGLAVLTASALVPIAIDAALDLYFRLSDGQITIFDVALRVGGAAVVATATWGATRIRREVRSGERHFLLRLPTAGLSPITIAAAILILPSTLASLFTPSLFRDLANQLVPGRPLYAILMLVLMAIFTVLLSLAFHRPRAVAELLARRPGPPLPARDLAEWSRGPLLAATALSILFLGAILTIGDYLRWAAQSGGTTLLTVVGTAVALDLSAEWRARRDGKSWVAVWPLHRVWAVDVACEALAEAGIACHPRALRFRSLWHFFAPHVPIDLLVPADRAGDARAILDALFDPTAPAEPHAGEVARA